MSNTLTYTLKLSNAAFVGPAREAQRSLQGVGGSASGAGAGFSRMAGGIAKAAAALGGITGVLAGFGAAIRQAANMETMQVAFANLIGSADKAKATLKGLSDFAATTPFELPEVVKAARTLLGAGVAAEKVEGALQSMGNVAAAFGADLSTVATITAQVINKSQLYAEELQQLGENGVPALQLLSDSMGISTAAVIEMATAGKLSAADLAKAFDDAAGAGGKFAAAMMQQSQTTAGLWSTLKDGVGALARQLGEPINDHMLKPLMADAIEQLPSIAAALQAVGQIARAAFSAEGLIGVADILQLALRLAFAKSVKFFAGALWEVGKAVIGALGQALAKVFSGDFSGLAKVLELSPLGRIGDLIDTEGLQAQLGKAIADVGAGSALDELSAALQGKLREAARKGTKGGLADGLSDGGRSGGDKSGGGGGGGGGMGGGAGGGEQAAPGEGPRGHIARGTTRRGDGHLMGLPEGFTPAKDADGNYRQLSGLEMHELRNLRRPSKAPGGTERGTSNDLVIPIGRGFDQGTDPKRKAGFDKIGGLREFEDLQNRMRKVGDKRLPTPGQQAKEERKKQEEADRQRQANEQKPRWDLVASIDNHIKRLTAR